MNTLEAVSRKYQRLVLGFTSSRANLPSLPPPAGPGGHPILASVPWYQPASVVSKSNLSQGLRKGKNLKENKTKNRRKCLLSLRRESGDRNKTDAVASARLQSPGYQTRPSRHCASSQAWLGRRGLSEPWFLPGQIGPWPPTPSDRGSSPPHVWQHPAGHSAGALQTRGHRGQTGGSGRPLGVQQTGFGSQGARSH